VVPSTFAVNRVSKIDFKHLSASNRFFKNPYDTLIKIERYVL